MQTVLYVLLGILMLGICVLVHEFGHYTAARILKLPVIEFAVGMGPKLWSKQKNGIQYSLRAIPLGGFCAFESEDEEASAFNSHPAWKRLVMTASGPLMNFVLGFVIAVILLSCVGEQAIVSRLAEVTPNTPAAQAGLLAGDEIVAVDGVYGDTEQILNDLTASGEEPVSMTVRRDGQEFTATVGKALSEDGTRYLMGVTFAIDRVRTDVFTSIGVAARFCVELTGQMLKVLYDLIFHGVGVQELSGPVGVVSAVTTIAQQSFAESFMTGLDNMLRLTLVISLNLGLMNLLPLPALDGGRVVLLAFEAIFKKHMPRKAENIMNTVALFALLALIVVITGKDILTLVGVI